MTVEDSVISNSPEASSRAFKLVWNLVLKSESELFLEF